MSYVQRRNVLLTLVLAICAGPFASFAAADAVAWDAFVIRNSDSGNTAPPTSENASGQGITTEITLSGQKSAYGTSAFDGRRVGDLLSLNYTRLDAGTKDPYLNIWVTDGTNYAVIAPMADMTNTGNYTSNDVNGLNLQSLGFNIYEYNSANFDWLVAGAQRVNSALLTSSNQVITLADIANLRIDDPNPGMPQGGTGAPKHGSGFNIVFGDTQGNFTSPVAYNIDNVNVATVVPLPAAAWAGMALIVGVGVTRKLRAGRVQEA